MKAPKFYYVNTSSMDRMEIRRSPIHGKGLFAMDPLKKNTCIGEYTGKIVRTTEGIDDPTECIFDTHCIDFGLNKKETIRGSRSCPLIFTNHLKRPNCEARAYRRKIKFYTIRPVKAGAELTINYHCDCRRCKK